MFRKWFIPEVFSLGIQKRKEESRRMGEQGERRRGYIVPPTVRVKDMERRRSVLRSKDR